MKNTLKALIGAGLILIAGKTAKADEYFLKAGNAIFNPIAYNDKIKQISVDDKVLGATSDIGIGYRKELSDKLELGADLDSNSQTIGKYKQMIATEEKIKYGEETLSVISLTPKLTYKLPITKTTTFEAGFGIPVSQITLTSSNDLERISETYTQVGLSLNLGLKQKINVLDVPIFGRINASYETIPKIGDFDASNSKITFELGREF